MDTHAYARTQLVIIWYLQNRPTEGWGWLIQTNATTTELLLRVYRFSWKVRFIYKYQWSERWHLSSAAAPRTPSSGNNYKLLPSPVSSSTSFSISFVFRCLHISTSQFWFTWLHSVTDCLLPLSSQFPEPRQPLRPPAYLQFCIFSTSGHYCYFLHTILKFLSAQLLMG